MKEPMYMEGKACWLNHLEAALEQYNNRVHGTIKTTSFEMSTNNKTYNNTAKLASHTEGASRTEGASHFKISYENKLSKFQLGDYVRVPEKMNFYLKGYTVKWKRELFKTHKTNKTNPVRYGLVDENKEQVDGNDYEQELLTRLCNIESNNKTLQSMNFFYKIE